MTIDQSHSNALSTRSLCAERVFLDCAFVVPSLRAQKKSTKNKQIGIPTAFMGMLFIYIGLNVNGNYI